jgi:hypothetical protein
MPNLQPFVGTIAGITPIPLPLGWSGASAQAINAADQVAGLGQVGGPPQPWIGTASGMTQIPLPAGWLWAGVSGINDFGQVAGSGGPSISAGPPHQAFFGTESGITPIPYLPGSTEMWLWWEHHPLNNAGQVVGWSDLGGWIWDPVNGTRALSDLVPPEWQVVDGRSINNRGQIVAWTHAQQTGFGGLAILDPVPEPATGILLAGGLFLLTALARRKRSK